MIDSPAIFFRYQGGKTKAKQVRKGVRDKAKVNSTCAYILFIRGAGVKELIERWKGEYKTKQTAIV